MDITFYCAHSSLSPGDDWSVQFKFKSLQVFFISYSVSLYQRTLFFIYMYAGAKWEATTCNKVNVVVLKPVMASAHCIVCLTFPTCIIILRSTESQVYSISQYLHLLEVVQWRSDPFCSGLLALHLPRPAPSSGHVHCIPLHPPGLL